MKLSELIHNVWKDERTRKLGIRKSEVAILVKVVIDHILEGLLNNKKIKIQGLFTLSLRKAKGRKIRNPHTKEAMHINDYYKVNIKPSERLKKGLEEIRDK